MFNTLITGENSYIGNSFEKFILSSQSSEVTVNKISLRDKNVVQLDLNKYDTILHVAGIAHTSTDENMRRLYYDINTNLTYELAKRAKENGVKHFVFLSSIIVYGSNHTSINANTIETPDDFYGDSKLQAENKIKNLESNDFTISIIRTPMVYGPKSKGNFAKLVKHSSKLIIFPNVNNIRSQLYIYNLCALIYGVIIRGIGGTIHPQNDEKLSTFTLIKLIRQAEGKKTLGVSIFNPVLNILSAKISIFSKLFSNLYYEDDITFNKFNYNMYNNEDSVKTSVKDL